MQRPLHSFLEARFLGLCMLSLLLGAPVLQAQSVNDMFTNPTPLTGTNTTTSGSNAGATWEEFEPYHAGVDCHNSVWWTWTAPAIQGVASITTAGSSFDTVLAAYTGTAVSDLVWIAYNDDENDATRTSKLSFPTAPGETYQIAVDGFSYAVGTISLRLNWAPPPPFTRSPAPSWALPGPSGAMSYSSNYTGKVVLLFFWATYNPVSVAELLTLKTLQSKYAADGLVIIGASMDTDPATVVDFLATSPLNFPVVMANSNLAAGFGGIPAIPTAFVIGTDNVIKSEQLGSLDQIGFENQLIPLLYGNTRLQWQLGTNQVVLRWPTNAVKFNLESGSTSTGVGWAAWPVQPSLVNGSNTVVLPMERSATNRLFRLRMSY
jgi:peroxiredoxin